MALTLLGRFGARLKLEAITPYFAHTNSAKCCQNKQGRRAADARLFRNCSQYIGREVRVLRPDVLVTQGKHSFDAIQAAIDDHTISAERTLLWSDLRSGKDGVLKIGGQEVIWLATFHPRFGGFYSQRQLHWPRWSKLVWMRFKERSSLAQRDGIT
jgi:hypothetical protein